METLTGRSYTATASSTPHTEASWDDGDQQDYRVLERRWTGSSPDG